MCFVAGKDSPCNRWRCVPQLENSLKWVYHVHLINEAHRAPRYTHTLCNSVNWLYHGHLSAMACLYLLGRSLRRADDVVQLVKHLDALHQLAVAHQHHVARASRRWNRSKLSLVGAATSIIFFATSFVMTKQIFCHNKSMLAATKLLSRQNYVCRDKIFLLRQKFCHGKYLSRQAYF